MNGRTPVEMISIGKDTVAMSELIDAHVHHLRAKKARPTTIRSRARLLRQLHDFLPFGLAYAATEELEDFLQSDPDWRQWTVCTYAMHIRGFYRWADGRLLQGDPSADMVRPGTPDLAPNPITEEELAVALERAPEPWLTGIILAAFGGLRASEAAGVHRQHVTEQSIWIVEAKGGGSASVDTHETVWRHVRDRPPGPLCRRPDGRPVDGHWFSSRAHDYFPTIGLPGFRLHRCRHRFGTMLLEQGWSLRHVQEAMRHKSITSTQGYTKIRDEQRRLAIRSLPTPSTQQPLS